MCCSRPGTFFAIVLTLVFALSTVCFAAPAGQVSRRAGEMPGGCHGNDGPMPTPAPVHSCCFAAHQVPALTANTRPPLALDTFHGDTISAASLGEPPAGLSAPVPALQISPPLTTVLRL